MGLAPTHWGGQLCVRGGVVKGGGGQMAVLGATKQAGGGLISRDRMI